jgi:stage V sporulation protein S
MLAAAIAHAIYDNHFVDIRAIGAGAVNQAVKAVAIARGYTGPRGFNIACSPGFANVKAADGDGEITAIVLHVFVI